MMLILFCKGWLCSLRISFAFLSSRFSLSSSWIFSLRLTFSSSSLLFSFSSFWNWIFFLSRLFCAEILFLIFWSCFFWTMTSSVVSDFFPTLLLSCFVLSPDDHSWLSLAGGNICSCCCWFYFFYRIYLAFSRLFIILAFWLILQIFCWLSISCGTYDCIY